MDIMLTYLSLLAIIFFLYKTFIIPSKAYNKKNLPPSPPSIPILGHLHLVKPPYYQDFQTLSKTYGPIISLRLGYLPILVVSSPSLAEECLIKNDIVFSDKPNFIHGQHLGYNFSHIVWSPYGEHWRNLRRIATLTMLSLRKVSEASGSRNLEIRNMIKKLLSVTRSVDLNDIIDELTRNSAMRLVNGKTWDKEADPHYYTDDILKGHILIMLLGAQENIAKAIKWAMSSLLHNPNILAKARTEIDTYVGKGRLVNDCDLLNLNYLKCIVNETLRQVPISPILNPHYSSKDCTIGGFHIPKGTTLYVNAWAIHMDPNLWDEPNVFKPERFENDQKHGFKFFPFGIGRRACPGINMSYRYISLTLATLIQCFNWEAVDSRSMKDMTMKPLEAICHPRSSMVDVLSQISQSS
ncbi:unnamed protein product [Amaranthus hypochondriacus]